MILSQFRDLHPYLIPDNTTESFDKINIKTKVCEIIF